MPTIRARQSHLDAIRGCAAIVVAVFHFLRSFDNQFLLATPSANLSPLSALWNGHFAVQVFFVLSGFLFFGKFYGVTGQEAFAGAAKRYLRLTLPALAVCLVAWAIHVLAGFSNTAAGAISGSDWLVRWYRFPPDLFLAFSEPMATMYLSFDALRSYNSNLWTIRYELFSVWLVIAIAVLCGRVGKGWQAGLLLVAAGLSIGTYTFPFIVGAATAFLRNVFPRELPAAVASILACVALALGALHVRHWISFDPTPVVWPLASALLIGAADSARVLRNLLSNRALAWVGSLSFGIYLVHMVTVNSVASSVFIASSSLVVTAAAYAVATIVGAVAFRHLVDEPSQGLLRKVFGSRKLERRPSDAKGFDQG